MAEQQPVAIVDIGSNSVRLVVYSGPTRAPSIVFNEKVMAGLGRGLNGDGTLPSEAKARALEALRRFRLLLDQMRVRDVHAVATAAVRDAADGADFLDEVRRVGFDPEMLSGANEGLLAGLGVISSIPDTDGIVGDLGGGSLELVDVAGREIRRSVSLPLGVFRLKPILKDGEAAFRRHVEELVAQSGLAQAARDRPFYLVGGSWRALSRYDMLLTKHPLPITHQHEMVPSRARELTAAVAGLDKASARKIPSLSSSRVPTLPHASLLLETLVGELKPSRLIVSSFGIREGLLYQRLRPDVQLHDPLIEGVREAGTGLGRFTQHGELLDSWIAPLFDDSPARRRLRLAACHLADVAWQAHPEFRAERGLDMALHGNWVGIDAPGRVMLAQALFSSFGGGRELPDAKVAALCRPEDRTRAANWGLAIRLGQRLSGGVRAGLEDSRLVPDREALRLEIAGADAPLYGDAVERRLKTLAAALGLKPEFRLV